MAAPVINPLSSIQEHLQWATWKFQPAANQAEVVVGTGVVNTGTEVFTWSAAPPPNGSRVRLKTAGTLPGGFASNMVYFTRDVSGFDCKLAATAGGAAIDATSAETGTMTLAKAFTWAAEGLPDGMAINEFTGLVSGAVIIPGVYDVTLSATNYAGETGSLVVPVGIEPVASAGVQFPTLIWNTLTGVVSGIGSNGSIVPASNTTPVIYLKSLDNEPVIFRFKAGGYYTPSLTTLKLTLKADDTEKAITLSAGGRASEESLGIVTADGGADSFTQPTPAVSDGERVRFVTTDTLPAGLTDDGVYFVVNSDLTDWQVSVSPGGPVFGLGDAGVGSLTVIRLPNKVQIFGADDWGYAVMLVSVDSSKLKTLLSDNENRGGTFAYAVGELELQMPNAYDPGGDPIVLTSRFFLAQLERGMTPN